MYANSAYNTRVECLYNVVKRECGEGIARILLTAYQKRYATIAHNCTIG